MQYSYDKKNVLVIGLGISGISACKFLLNAKANVWAVDKNKEKLASDPQIQTLKKSGVTICHEEDPLNVDNIDLAVLSPGVPLTHPLYQKVVKKGIEVIGEVELAFRMITQPVLAITGTNGKTTTTLLVEHVLNYNGKPAKALGNVGEPLTAELQQSDRSKIIVAELSSYQLETMKSKVIDAAVLLNVTPDHLDRYKAMEIYAKAKFLVKNYLKSGAPFFIEEKTLKEYGHLLEGAEAISYGFSPSSKLYADDNAVYFNKQKQFELMQQDRGTKNHDLENQLAAFALCRTMGITGDQFLAALPSFKKPPHRIEFVREIGGVKYYDDSKGTNIDAVIRAVLSLNGNIVLIAGGVDKGFHYTPWIDIFKNRVKSICAIGEAAEKIKEEMSSCCKVEIFESLEKAVQHASHQAKKGENVLLSPGCSSFDMFKDYAHRGDEFKRIVNELTTPCSAGGKGK